MGVRSDDFGHQTTVRLRLSFGLVFPSFTNQFRFGFLYFHSARRVERTFTMVDELWGIWSHALRTTNTQRRRLKDGVLRFGIFGDAFARRPDDLGLRVRGSRERMGYLLAQRLAIDVWEGNVVLSLGSMA